jgi:hypothetical protein
MEGSSIKAENTQPANLDDLHEQQRRNVAAVDGEERQRLIDRYRERNRLRKRRTSNPRPDLFNSSVGPSSSGRYGAGTGRGELPSRQRIRDVDQGPTLLEQLRRDGSK